jgi:nickel-type superoxide dismutase maturation protease
MRTDHDGTGSRWRGWVGAAVLTYGAVLAVNRSLVVVRGPSMEPALWAGDRLLTVPARRGWLAPGQVVVVADPQDPDHLVVKRLTALGSGKVEVLGDNPAASTDSRTWGRLPLAAIRRIAVARWPDVRSPLRRPV